MPDNSEGMIRRLFGRFFGGGLSRGPGPQSGEAQMRSAPTPVVVTFDTAMQLSAVWACARLLSETIASRPIKFWVVRNGVREPDTQSILPKLFNGKINRYQTVPEFLESYMLNWVLHGNAYAWKQRDSSGEIVSLLPLMSSQVEVEVLNDGTVIYRYHTSAGVMIFGADDIMHSRLFSNGVMGLSPLSYARNTLGIGLAGEKQVGAIFANGGKPTGVLMSDKILNAEQRRALKKEFEILRTGTANELAVLEAGFQYQQISMTPQDIQLLESRRFQIEDIARFFGVPSVLINDTQAGTTWGSGIHQIMQGFYKLGLNPYTNKLAQTFKTNLVDAGALRDSIEIEFDFFDLISGNMSERIAAYSQAINAAWMKPNEARAREGMTWLAEGDELMVNGNMVLIEAIREALRDGNQATQT